MLPVQNFTREYDEVIGQQLDRACRRVLRSGRYILGEEVSSFEAGFTRSVGRDHGIGVASGLDALLIGLTALEIGPGDEVVTTPLSAAATALAISRCGAKPVFVDVEPSTLGLDPQKVRSACGPRTKAVLVVHLYGTPAQGEALRGLCDELGIALVEDCAQAHLAEGRSGPVGGLGRFAAYSFYPTKNLGAVGDAGLITTDDAELAARCQRLRDYGQRAKYEHAELGFNSRLDELQAAILKVKLEHLPAWTEQRGKVADRYGAALAGYPIELPRVPTGVRPAWHIFAIRHPRRDDLQRALAGRGIATAIHYPTLIPDQPCYRARNACRVVGALDVAAAVAGTTLSLPIYPGLTSDEIQSVVDAVGASIEAL